MSAGRAHSSPPSRHAPFVVALAMLQATPPSLQRSSDQNYTCLYDPLHIPTMSIPIPLPVSPLDRRLTCCCHADRRAGGLAIRKYLSNGDRNDLRGSHHDGKPSAGERSESTPINSKLGTGSPETSFLDKRLSRRFGPSFYPMGPPYSSLLIEDVKQHRAPAEMARRDSGSGGSCCPSRTRGPRPFPPTYIQETSTTSGDRAAVKTLLLSEHNPSSWVRHVDHVTNIQTHRQSYSIPCPGDECVPCYDL